MEKIFILIILASSFFRIPLLLKQPPFIDEMIYATHIDIITRSLSWENILLPAKNGLSPLFIYFSSIVNTFLKNPILAGRVTSLIFYYFSSFLLYIYLKKIKAKWWLPGITFFLVNPFIFLYSQMSMMETTLLFCCLLFMIQTENTLLNSEIKKIALLSLSFILVLFSKYIGIFILFYLIIRSIQEKKIKIVFLFFLFFLAGFFISLPFILPFTERALALMEIHSSITTQNLLKQITLNFRLITYWLVDYYSVIIVALIIIILVLKKNKYATAAFITFISIVIYFSFFAKGFFPRYFILSTIVFAVILANIKINRNLSIIFALFIIFTYAKSDYYIAVNLEKAKIAREDVWQYATDWTSGKNIVSNLKRLKSGETICVPGENYQYFYIVNTSFFPGKKINYIKISDDAACPKTIKIVTPKSL